MPTDPGLNFYYVIFKFYNILTAIKYCEITGNTKFLVPCNQYLQFKTTEIKRFLGPEITKKMF